MRHYAGLTPFLVLLDLIDAHLIGPNEPFIEMTAAEIQHELTCDTSACRNQAQRLLQGSTTCGRYLSRLVGMSPRVQPARTSERRAYRITRRGGTTVTAGLPDPTQRLQLPPVQLVAEERTLKGSYVGSCVPSRDIPRYVALYRAGRLPVDRLLSETIALEDINAAFDRLADGKTVRQVIAF